MVNLKEVQLQTGAVFSDSDLTPTAFPWDSLVLSEIKNGTMICDRSDWGLLEVKGNDRLRFLHNQSTNDFNRLQPGQGCDTVFVTSTARTLDLVTAYVQQDRVLLLTSPSRTEKLSEWMDRYLFPMDKVEINDLSSNYAIFTLIGPQSQELLSQWVSQKLLTLPEYRNQTVEILGVELILGVGSGLALPGFNLLIPLDKAGNLWYELTNPTSPHKAIPIGSNAWETLRILQGRPKPDAELTEDYNPLEVGLWQTISFNKGCYIGQETIARLNTYKGVKQRLLGIKFNTNNLVKTGDIITKDGEKIGVITSYIDTESGGFALGYIRTKSGGVGLNIEVENTKGEVVELPFIRHEYYQGNNE
jgi:folate-binding protein YgfZ